MARRQILSAREVAPLLGVTTGRVYQLLAAGDLPFFREGRAIRIPRAAWEAWLQEANDRALAGRHREASLAGEDR